MLCRSREGAWIEMGRNQHARSNLFRRSREGAWIEIHIRIPLA